MSTATVASSQVTDTPQLNREAQEVVSAAAETIRNNKITMEARSERIKMMRDQLTATQQALDLAIENDKLCNNVRKNQEAEIEFLQAQYSDMKREMKKERRRKIFWKCTSAGLLGLTLYSLLL
jgi:chromosome segregation ATPase